MCRNGFRQLWKRATGRARLDRLRADIRECRDLLREMMQSVQVGDNRFPGLEPRPLEWERANARLKRTEERLRRLALGCSPFDSPFLPRTIIRFAARPDPQRQEQSHVRRGA